MPYDKYEVVIGLEVHAQLLTHSKAFSSDAATYGESPNTQVSVITLGHPGTLPRVNKKHIELAVKMGLATNCLINKHNTFARKNYFYPDLPKGYQISQFTGPICYDGHLEVAVNDARKTIGITRIHIEEDAGKSLHDQDPYFTLIDLNRAGTPLIEIVSEPDMRSGDEAYAYLTEIRKIVRWLDICDGNMEEGSLRCDANISVRLKGAPVFGQKVEVKNMNSIRNVKRAIEHEVIRQIDLIEAGGKVLQETRTFDAGTGTTAMMRSKEEANDYRYFPEPDLPPIILTEDYIIGIKEKMPLLPEALKHHFIHHYKLSEYDASILTEEKATAAWFEDLCTHAHNAKAAANWVMGPIRSYINEQGIEMPLFPITAKTIAEVIHMIDKGQVSFSNASQKLFDALLKDPAASPEAFAKSLNILQNSDTDSILPLIEQALAKYPEKVAEYRAGKKGLMGLFMGEVMKLSQGKADPKVATKLLEEKLNA